MTTPKQIPPHNSARYKAGELIYREGAKTEVELLAAINFDRRAGYARNNLQSAIEGGWLRQEKSGRIDISHRARVHYEESAPAAQPEAPKGQVAEPRFINLMDRPAYKPAKPFRRADALDNSLAAMPSKFHKEQS
jgi:hypothetical protein